MTQKPILRQSFSFNAEIKESGYVITDSCISCGQCIGVCPTDCIIEGHPYVITQENCLRCGNCYDICPVDAIKKI